MPIKKLLPLLCLIILIGCADIDRLPSVDTGGVSSGSSAAIETATVPAVPLRDPPTTSYYPSADGVSVYSSDYVNIDYSNSSKGYIMVEYVGSHTGKVKFRVVDALENTYTYDLHGKTGYQVFHLHSGSGSYTFQTFEQSEGTQYYTVDTQTLTVTIEDELLPYLYPNQYVNFDENDLAVQTAQDLYTYTENDLDFIGEVFNFTIDTLKYDYEKAELAIDGQIAGYIPVVDEAITTGEGICFDYAALMTAMLRSQNVPTRMVFGYAGDVYHAWISVHTPETGWIENIIEFDGEKWVLMDPTFTDGGTDSSYIGNGENYAEKYIY